MAPTMPPALPPTRLGTALLRGRRKLGRLWRGLRRRAPWLPGAGQPGPGMSGTWRAPAVPLARQADAGAVADAGGGAGSGEPPTVIHLHIPKTAGTSLTSLLAQAVPRGTGMTVGNHDLQRLTALSTEERRRIRFLFGHLDHGVAALLPQPVLHVCCLREPGARLLSLFLYIARTEDHPLHKVVAAEQLDFGAFLERVAGMPGARRNFDNDQVHRLAGPGPAGEDMAATLERALAHLFAPDMVYGLTEEFEAFQQRLLARGLIRKPRDLRRNAAPERSDPGAALAGLSPAQRQIFDDFTLWDGHLYRIARAAWQATAGAAVAAPDTAPAPAVPTVFLPFAQASAAEVTSRPYQAWSRRQKTPLGWPVAQVMVSRRARVLYCPIGKVACSFLKQQMVRISDLPHAELVLANISRMTDRLRTGMQLADYPEAEARALLADPGMLRLAVVREPAARLLSAYIQKFVLRRNSPPNHLHTGPVVAAVQGQEPPDFDRGISFRAFIQHITAQPPQRLDPHWRPQALYLQGITWEVYAIEDMERVVALLEARSGLTLPREPRNVTGSGKGAARAGAADLLPAAIEAGPPIAAASFLEPGLQALITRHYAEDAALHRAALERIRAEAAP